MGGRLRSAPDEGAGRIGPDLAMGSGLALSATCDLRICTPAARFGLPIARTVGNCLSMANYARLAALLGEARLKEIVLTARSIEPGEALAIGLASEALRRLRAAGLPDGDDLVREAYASQDFSDRVAAFLAKS